MLTCVVVDDEPPAIKILTNYIRDTPYLSLTSSTTDILQAQKLLAEQPIDVLFLDIQMPKLTGLQFLRLYEGKTKVILTTAYPQHALESYEFSNVIDYLVKPISFERFQKSVSKALKLVNVETRPPAAAEPDMSFLLVKTEHKGKLRRIDYSDVAYVEGMLNYVIIRTVKGDKIITYMSMGDMEKNLPAHQFARVHRSYIVSLKTIDAIDGNELLLKPGFRIPVGGKYKEPFMQAFLRSPNE
ncbi:response regulator transcription factor [Spirosoma sp. BT704]|uniref:Response regulator transcription factor n=1 Tax=Spirosoma validum TaxID=2771355 RepID=A0A927B1W8_9BACT|nr:response regulator transcription factor [Spirosoma validum]